MIPDLTLSDILNGLDWTLFQNTVRDWLLAGLVTLGVWAAFWLAKRVLMRRLHRFARRTSIRWDDLVADLAERTYTAVLFFLALYVGSLVLALPPNIRAWIGALAFIVVLFQAGIWGNALIVYWIEQNRAEHLEDDAAHVTTMNAVSFVLRLIFYAILVLLALDNIPGVEVTALIASLGIGGIAVALAVQNILSDLFASLSIALDKPFVIGDFIVIGDLAGTVVHIGLKTTRLRSLWGEELIFANSDLLSSRIKNYKGMEERRVSFTVGVTYETPPEQLRRIPAMVEAIVASLDDVRFDRAHFKGFGDFSLDFEIVYYVLSADYNLYMARQQAINLALVDRFAAQGIDFAYPTQMVYVSGEGIGQKTAVSPRPTNGRSLPA